MASRFTSMQAPEIASTSIGCSGRGCLCKSKSRKRLGQQCASQFKPKARTKARQGVGIARRELDCSVPSGLSCNPPSIPAAESDNKICASRQSTSSSSQQSGFKNKIRSFFDCEKPILQAAANPRLTLLKIILKLPSSENCRAQSLAPESLEALSTSKISPACNKAARIHSET